MKIAISREWTATERRHVIRLLKKRLMKPIKADDIEIIMRKIKFLEENSATALEADSEWLLQGLNVERVKGEL